MSAGLLDYWRRAGRSGQWFAKDPGFDLDFRNRFLDLHLAAARGELDAWAGAPDPALARVILLDQFPRNAFRGTPHMYATDFLARAAARSALADFFERIDPELRLFLCLPFAHSEDLADQTLSVELNARLGREYLRHAQGHRDIVARFGRFPHRNALLGRASSAGELEFLRGGGFAG